MTRIPVDPPGSPNPETQTHACIHKFFFYFISIVELACKKDCSIFPTFCSPIFHLSSAFVLRIVEKECVGSLRHLASSTFFSSSLCWSLNYCKLHNSICSKMIKKISGRNYGAGGMSNIYNLLNFLSYTERNK